MGSSYFVILWKVIINDLFSTNILFIHFAVLVIWVPSASQQNIIENVGNFHLCALIFLFLQYKTDILESQMLIGVKLTSRTMVVPQYYSAVICVPENSSPMAPSLANTSENVCENLILGNSLEGNVFKTML